MKNRTTKLVAAGLMIMMLMATATALKPFAKKDSISPDNEAMSRIVTAYNTPPRAERTEQTERAESVAKENSEDENSTTQKPRFRLFGFKKKQQLEQKISDELKKPATPPAAPGQAATPAPAAASAATPAPSAPAQPAAPNTQTPAPAAAAQPSTPAPSAPAQPAPKAAA